MADQADVETALTSAVAATLYPAGAAAPSLLGVDVRIYRGWPNQAGLDADLAAGRVNVTIFPDQGQQRNTTRYLGETDIPTPALPTLTVSVAGETATFGGTAGAGQLAGLRADTVAAVHRLTASDTPQSVAAILAARLRTQRIVLLAGATVTVPGAYVLIGRVAADQSAFTELRRQRQAFRVTCWCADPATRDAAASAIDAALAAEDFLALPDGSFGHLRFHASTVFDQSEDAALYRRDLVYTVEYATTAARLLPAMLFGEATLAPDGGPVTQRRIG